MRLIPVLVLYTLSLAIWPASVLAMNWEGHDEWFHDNSLFQEFMEGVAPPIKKPLPTCEFVKQRHAENAYEQTPLPGRNCVEEKPS